MLLARASLLLKKAPLDSHRAVPNNHIINVNIASFVFALCH